MKKAFITLVFSALTVISYSQCCPYIDAVEIIPAPDTDETWAILTVTTPNQGSFLEADFTVTDNNIDITACYYSGMLTALQTYIDTVNLGVLESGDYTYTFYAYQSESPNTCTQINNETVSGSFEVDVINNLEEFEILTGPKYEVKIYPNPIRRSMLNIDTDAFIEMIEVYETSGRMVLFKMSDQTGSIGQIATNDLDKMVYQVVLTTKDGQQITKQLIIQR